ncbi:MAG: hypothetical protein HXS43_13580 [Theionarchaea archaeon]|nr:hypothetical protein [Theionarchaea archaeon]
MKQYFNLNERVKKAWENNNGGSLPDNAAAAYPEINIADPPDKPEELEELPHLSILRQVLMYLGAFLGVLLSSAIMQFRSGQVSPTIDLTEVIISAVVAFVIIPVVYEKLNLNPDAPFIVQFALFVQNGVFWHVLIDSIGSVL